MALLLMGWAFRREMDWIVAISPSVAYSIFCFQRLQTLQGLQTRASPDR